MSAADAFRRTFAEAKAQGLLVGWTLALDEDLPSVPMEGVWTETPPETYGAYLAEDSRGQVWQYEAEDDWEGKPDPDMTGWFIPNYTVTGPIAWAEVVERHGPMTVYLPVERPDDTPEGARPIIVWAVEG